MSSDPAEEQEAPVRSVHCKDYHRAKTAGARGSLASSYQRKSHCPSWAQDLALQQALINEALEDSGGALDSLGRPKRLWNAVEGYIFIGVSCNLSETRYNCYPERPPDGKLFSELQRRADRTRDEVLNRTEFGDG